jgi:hypothetical protein
MEDKIITSYQELEACLRRNANWHVLERDAPSPADSHFVGSTRAWYEHGRTCSVLIDKMCEQMMHAQNVSHRDLSERVVRLGLGDTMGCKVEMFIAPRDTWTRRLKMYFWQ